MRMQRIVASLVLSVAGGVAMAHHSYAPFDRTREVELKGTVRTWEMGNPHAYLWLYVANRKGGRDIWGFEAPAPTVLLRNGWDKNAVKVGDPVTVTLNPLKDGRTGGLLLSIRLADGRRLETIPNDRKAASAPASGSAR